MNTDARRKASAAYHAKRTAEGARKVTVWLSPEAQAALNTLAMAHGSKDAAVCAALTAATLGQRVRDWIEADPAAKPVPSSDAAKRKATAEAEKLNEAAGFQKATLNIQIGPVERKPGSLQKGSKK